MELRKSALEDDFEEEEEKDEDEQLLAGLENGAHEKVRTVFVFEVFTEPVIILYLFIF